MDCWLHYHKPLLRKSFINFNLIQFSYHPWRYYLNHMKIQWVRHRKTISSGSSDSVWFLLKLDQTKTKTINQLIIRIKSIKNILSMITKFIMVITKKKKKVGKSVSVILLCLEDEICWWHRLFSSFLLPFHPSCFIQSL